MKQNKKKGRDLQRRAAKRESYDLVLIVCEGECTEPNYFCELISSEGLSNVNIQVEHTNGQSAPRAVVDKAKTIYEQAKKNCNTEAHFDRVFCVFDRDDHSTFNEAVNKARGISAFTTICSYPSFEYWYLCHFEYSRAPIIDAQDCESRTRHKWRAFFSETYDKNLTGVYHKLQPRQQEALRNAAKSDKATETEGDPNPSTQVYQLVEYLLNLKK